MLREVSGCGERLLGMGRDQETTGGEEKGYGWSQTMKGFGHQAQGPDHNLESSGEPGRATQSHPCVF